MPIKCEIFPDLRVVLTIITGSIDDKACIDNARSLGKMPGFYSSFDQIIDLTGVTANLLTAEGLQEIAKITPFSPDSRRSFIISESNTVTKTGPELLADPRGAGARILLQDVLPSVMHQYGPEGPMSAD